MTKTELAIRKDERENIAKDIEILIQISNLGGLSVPNTFVDGLSTAAQMVRKIKRT